MQTVLVTGASGGIGTHLRRLLKGVYPSIRWSDRVALPPPAADETFVKADLAVMDEVERAVDGGEGLAALYAYKHGLRVTSLRIGNVSETPADKRRLSIWVRPEDLVQLIRIGLEHPDIRCEIFYGASDNTRGWWDNAAAFRFGYRPKHKAEDFREQALAAQAKLAVDPVGDWYQGGTFCSNEFDADSGKLAQF